MGKSIAANQLAHGRAGDKSDTLSISVIARDSSKFEHLDSHVTEAYCAAVFENRQPTSVMRYLLPKLSAMNFVIEGVLDGGVNRSLYADRHGKTLSSLLLDSEIPEPLQASGKLALT